MSVTEVDLQIPEKTLNIAVLNCLES